MLNEHFSATWVGWIGLSNNNFADQFLDYTTTLLSEKESVVTASRSFSPSSTTVTQRRAGALLANCSALQ
jgi:hypothetical protein